ncbi:hypothetical protein BDL97_02G027900 [Sphagnum fallax]|nr:hypothetical protein BDL97_02G027900 [Sphagnum fallax]
MGCGLKAIFFYKRHIKKIAQLWREVQICNNQMAVIKFATVRDSEAGNSESFQVVLCQELCPKVSQHQLKLMRLIVGVEPRSRWKPKGGVVPMWMARLMARKWRQCLLHCSSSSNRVNF